MKRSYVTVCALLFSATTFAQQKISEGSVTYAVEYQLPDNMKPYAAYFPKEATVYFKGDSTISVQKSTGRTTSVVTNKKTDFMRLLLDMQAKQFVISFSPAEMEEMQLSIPEFTYTPSTQTQTMANYTATKYELKDPKTGAVTEAWFTKDVVIPPNSLDMAFDEAQGTPLMFTTAQSGITVKATIKEIKAGPVPAGIFQTPKGYEAMTMQQLKAMNGGK